MARKCFYSFHYKKDNWRVSQVRNIGAVEGSKTVKDNNWEKVTKGGDKKIKEWIDEQMKQVLLSNEVLKNCCLLSNNCVFGY